MDRKNNPDLKNDKDHKNKDNLRNQDDLENEDDLKIYVDLKKGDNLKKSQNCVKAAIAFVCTGCKRQVLTALLQLTTVLSTTATINFCMHHCNFQHFNRIL